MPSPSPTVDPFSNPDDWTYFNLGGQSSPGTIPRGGMTGFKRETGWDIKKGKGTQGATLTLKEMPPIEGKIVLQLFTQQDFADWDQFVALVLSISPKAQLVEGLPIFYPGFSSIGLTQVVVKHYTMPEHQGKGLYHATIEVIEWQPPPATSVVSTVNSVNQSTPDPQSPGIPTPDQKARKQAADAQLGLLNQGSNAPSR